MVLFNVEPKPKPCRTVLINYTEWGNENFTSALEFDSTLWYYNILDATTQVLGVKCVLPRVGFGLTSVFVAS